LVSVQVGVYGVRYRRDMKLSVSLYVFVRRFTCSYNFQSSERKFSHEFVLKAWFT
jgi:hypothetical protein